MPQRPVGARLPLRWAHEYLAAPLPAPSYPIDVSEGIADFGMLGNDLWGDCVTAAGLHGEMTTAVAAGVAPRAPTDPAAVVRYQSYTGAQQPPGPGCVIADYLLWLYNQGLILAFAPVDISNLAQADAFMAAGFGLLRGVELTDQDEARFNAGEPWTVADGEQPDPELGHAILTVGATGPSPADLESDVTWGRQQPATRAWSQACTDEAWLVVTTEEQAAKFTSQLLADVQTLGGTGIQPITPPAPVGPPPQPPNPAPPNPAPPEPPQPPTPPAPLGWWQEFEAWFVRELLPFLDGLDASGRGMDAGYLGRRGRDLISRRHDDDASGIAGRSEC